MLQRLGAKPDDAEPLDTPTMDTRGHTRLKAALKDASTLNDRATSQGAPTNRTDIGPNRRPFD